MVASYIREETIEGTSKHSCIFFRLMSQIIDYHDIQSLFPAFSAWVCCCKFYNNLGDCRVAHAQNARSHPTVSVSFETRPLPGLEATFLYKKTRLR